MFNFEKDRKKHSKDAELINLYITALFILNNYNLDKVIEAVAENESVWTLLDSYGGQVTPEKEIPLLSLILLRKLKTEYLATITPFDVNRYKESEEICLQGIKDFYHQEGVYQI